MSEAARFTEVSDLAPAADSLREIRHHIHHHPGTGLRGTPDGRAGRREARAMGLAGHARRRRDGRGGHAESGRRQAQHRHSRRHGRAADRRANRPAVCERHARQDARMRPRRPHDDAARRRATARGHAQFLRHGASVLPAGRRERHRQRRAEDDQRRPVRALSLRRRVRRAQPSGRRAGRAAVPQRAVHVGGRQGDHHDRRRRRPRGASASDGRSGGGGGEHRDGVADRSSRATSIRRNRRW